MAYPSDSQYVPISITVNGVTQTVFDVLGDESPSSTDIVGNATFPAAYFAYDGANVYFRLRLNTDPRTNQLSGFRNFSWGVLIRTTSPPGFYDYMFNVNGLNSTVNIWQNTAQIFNSWNDPAEVLVVSQPISNFNFARVLPANSSFGGDPDFFLDWFLPATTFFNAIGITPTTQISTIFYSAANANNYNKDSLRTSEGFSFIASQSDPISPDDVDVRAELQVTKNLTSGPNPVLVGQQATWTETITVTNTGRSNATSVTVTDLIGLDTVSSFTIGVTSQGTGVYTSSNKTLSWNIGTIAPGGTATLSYSATGIFSTSGTRTLDQAQARGFDSFTGGNISSSFNTSVSVAAAGSLFGRILDNATGLPIIGATISISGPASLQTTSNSGGNYSFSNIPSGNYTVTVIGTNYQQSVVNVTVPANTALERDILLTPVPGTVNGQVTTGISTPVDGVTMTLIDSFGTVRGTTTTAGGGLYSFTNVPPGSYTVTAANPAYQFESRGITVLTNQVTTLNFNLIAIVGTISGTITPNMVPTTISVFTSEGILVTSLENVMGTYSITGLAPGSYTVRANADGYVPQQIGAVLTLADLSTEVDFNLVASTGQLTGQIRDGDDITNPLIPGTVNLFNGLGQNIATVVTATGNYSFTGVEPGSYTLVFTSDGYASRTIGFIMPTPPGAEVVNVSLNKLAGNISGSVNVPGATINLLQNGILIGVTQADSNGNYSFTSLAPGSYTVVATANNFETAVSGAVVEAFETTTINFILAGSPGAIFGEVDPDINGALVTIRQGSATGPIVATTVTGTFTDGMVLRQGYYRVPNLAPGNYVVFVNALGFESAASGAVVTSNAETEVNFTLTNNSGFISGTILSTGGPISAANVEVRLLDASGGVVATVITDGNGNYQTPDLAFGTYTLIASAPGFQTNGATVILDQAELTDVDIFLLPNPGSIQGTIVNADAPTQGITGATVQVIDQNGILIQTIFTDSQGFYRSDGLAPGGYTVIAFAANFEQGSVGTIVIADTTSVANLALNTQPGSISGTISDELSAPIPNAQVQIYTSTNQFIASVITDSAGFFNFSNLAPGNYIVTATAPTFSTAGAGVIVTANTNTDVDITLSSVIGSLSGTINTLDAPAQTIPNAIVTITDINETILGTAFTDANGFYSIGGLPVGNVIVTVTAPDFSTVALGSVIAAGANTLDVTLSRTVGNISGTVASILDPGNYIPNATIVVRSVATNTVVATVSTDQNGAFFIPALSVGSYSITASAPNFSTEVQGVTVLEGITSAANILLQPTSFTVTGVVTDGTNPLVGPNIQVALYNTNNVLVATTLANSLDGSFQFINIPNGTYFVTASAPAFNTNTVSVIVDGVDASLNVPLSAIVATVNVTVLVADTMNGIPGALVTVRNASNNLILATGVTDENGEVTFTNLPEASLTITASAENFGTDTKGLISDSMNPQSVVLELSPLPGNLEGYVIDVLTGQPINGSTITLVDFSNVIVGQVVSGQDGFYQFNGINPGTYTVYADSVNFGPQTAGAIIISNETVNLGFALLPNPGFVSGSVSNGTPIPNASILIREGSNTGPIVWNGVTDNDGNFLSTGLNPGTYIVFVSADGYASAQLGTIIVSDTTNTLSFMLDQNEFTITGTITNNGLGLADTLVRIIDIDGNIVGTTQTSGQVGNEGFYSISGIPEGFYTVTAINVNYQVGLTTIQLLADTNNVDLELGDNPVNLSGVVFDGLTSIPLVGAVVEIYDSNTSLLVRRTLSTVNGQYLAEGLAPGNYRIITTYPNYELGLDQLVLPALQPSTLNIPLNSNPGSVSGVVSGPQMGSSVTVVIVNTNLEIVTTLTDNAGNYFIPGLTAGDYNLVVSSPGFVTESIPFTITPGGNTTVNVTLDPNTSPLQVIVEDNMMNRLENARVLVYSVDGANLNFVVSGLTDNNGEITFNNLRDGVEYLVIVQSEGYVSEQQFVILPSGAITFSLDDNPSTLTGLVYNRLNGTIINGAIVTITGSGVGPFTDVTSNGLFFFDSLPAGVYEVTITAPGFQSRTFEVTIPELTDLLLEFSLLQNSPCSAVGEVEVSTVTVDDEGNIVPLSSLVTLTQLGNPEEENGTRYVITVSGYVVLSYSSETQQCTSRILPLSQVLEEILIETPSASTVTLSLEDIDVSSVILCQSITEEGTEEFIPSEVQVNVNYRLVTTTRTTCGTVPPSPKPVDPCDCECEEECRPRVCEMSLYEYFRYKNALRRKARGEGGYDSCKPSYPPTPIPRVFTSVVTQDQVTPYTFIASQVLFDCLDI